jgi:hypothetical protein
MSQTFLSDLHILPHCSQIRGFRVCRQECQPILLPVIPARIAAGRMIFLSNVSGDRGFPPFRGIEGNKKSPLLTAIMRKRLMVSLPLRSCLYQKT